MYKTEILSAVDMSEKVNETPLRHRNTVGEMQAILTKLKFQHTKQSREDEGNKCNFHLDCYGID